MSSGRRTSFLLAPSALLWLTGVLAPLVLVLRMSLYSRGAATGEQLYDMLLYQPGSWSVESFVKVLTEPFYLRTFGFTAILVAVVSLITLACGYLLGYAVYRATPRGKVVLILLIVLPKFNNILVLVHGVKMILGPSGFWPVVAGEVLMLVPYAALTIAAALEAVPYHLVEAARGLGATAAMAFWQVTLPLSLPGVSAAAILTILWSASAFLAPYLLGQPAQYTVAVEVDRQVHMDLNWPLAAALNVVLMGILAVAAYGLSKVRRRFAV
jgi:ABC-type spermidine/putrescine transport system permease subunit I